jgi:hypothetical protein
LEKVRKLIVVREKYDQMILIVIKRVVTVKIAGARLSPKRSKRSKNGANADKKNTDMSENCI